MLLSDLENAGQKGVLIFPPKASTKSGAVYVLMVGVFFMSVLIFFVVVGHLMSPRGFFLGGGARLKTSTFSVMLCFGKLHT